MAKEILARVRARAERLPHPPKIVALVGNETPATRSYLAIKEKRAADAGCVFDVRRLDLAGIKKNDRSAAILDSVRKAADEADAVIVQLPLPNGIAVQHICDAIPVEKDADVLSSAARAQFKMLDLRNSSLLPPVVGAVKKILEVGNVEMARKRAVVIGRGFLVGAPTAAWLRQRGAQVKIADSKTENLARLADIIVTGVGVPHLVKPDMVKEGAVVIDAGTSESDGALAGDVSPSCAVKCSLFTPVPGGVGPLAVACLFENAVTLAEQSVALRNLDSILNK
ncbi:MAG: bifunctional 5,10-methylenetetrahydrofolate dehydrogenase/5,10-methenyltetrahydrofolate cyclohydrolase [Candidatus Liptonbacteria bacterium]|nr:bifunctional 5,10-methylenetetrahydrofolate dehydrogenase/5,10-methenyltetrahydrofolate cyclohydrolase [Candidatus Liptonbacteria bacterium]